jgi:hypothetical protein
MQAKLERRKAAFRMHGVGLSVAILASATTLASATLSLSAPDRALASCGPGAIPLTRQRPAAAAYIPRPASQRRQAVVAAEAEASDAQAGPAPRRRTACELPLRAECLSPAYARGRTPRLMRGPLGRGPRTPSRKCTALGMRIASEAAEVSRGLLVPHEFEPVDVHQPHVGDLEVRDDRQRQEGDLQERFGQGHP